MHRWPPIGLRASAAKGSGPIEATLEVVVSGGEVSVQLDGRVLPGGWDRVESELGLFSAERLSSVVAVHAAVVEVDGQAIVVAGASRSGKTSLCEAARSIGLRVHTDEFALVDSAAQEVSGWHRSMRVRTPQGIRRVPLDVEVGARLPIGLVVLATYDQAGAGLRSLEQGAVVLGLLENTVCAQRRPDAAFAAAVAVARSVPGVGGSRGEASEALAELIGIVRRGAAR
jgi:hypothetical protein